MTTREKVEALEANIKEVRRFLQKMQIVFPDATEIANIAFANEAKYQLSLLKQELNETTTSMG